MRVLLAALCAAFFVSAAQAEMTAREAAELLSAATVEYSTKRGEAYCTAFAIGPTTFMSAGHCATFDKSYLSSEDDWTTVSSVEVGVGDKTTRADAHKDWSILTAYDSLDDVVPLELACGEELYIGMQIAYMGNPSPLRRFFGVGYLGSLEESRSRYNDSDGIVDLAAGPGASGSPVISMDTGNVIGILTEGYFTTAGSVMWPVGVGLELLSADHCPDGAEIEEVGPGLVGTF